MIKAASEKLTQKFQEISAKMYQNAAPQDGGAQGGQQAGGQQTNSNGDTYYDADFTDVSDEK